ncbi:MAG: hypothetical protein U0L72_09600 [Acutalibacteraceae bacterium]|nr:hypothetical protein [Acutalibacteraceae bacterium]
MTNEICYRIDENFKEFLQKSQEEISVLLKNSQNGYLSIELNLFLGEFVKKCKNKDYKYLLYIYADEKNSYKVCRNLIAERIISEDYEIFSLKNPNIIGEENADILYAYSEAIKNCTIKELLYKQNK